ncbi:MAG: MipA/OmpV family protein, partial [Pseudomonadales bacterium]
MKRVTLAVAAIICSSTVLADMDREPERDTWEIELGVGAASYKPLYKGFDSEVQALPMFAVRYNEFFLDGPSVGYEFYSSERMSAYTSIGLDDPFSGERSDSDDAGVKALGDVDSGVNLTTGGEMFTPVGLLSASISRDVSGEHDGISASLEWAVPFEYEALTLLPNAQISWASKDLVNHYYGVSAKQAAKSGFAQYSASSTTTYSVGVNAEYQLSDHWVLMGGLSYTQYGSAVADSPLT